MNETMWEFVLYNIIYAIYVKYLHRHTLAIIRIYGIVVLELLGYIKTIEQTISPEPPPRNPILAFFLAPTTCILLATISY